MRPIMKIIAITIFMIVLLELVFFCYDTATHTYTTKEKKTTQREHLHFGFYN
jgi:hypothetical protein